MAVDATPSLSDSLDSAFEGATDSPEPAADLTPAPETAPVEAAEATGEAEGEPVTPEATDEPDPPPVAQEDPEDAILSLSAEELAEIKSNPATAKLYKSLMRASTAKFQEISADKKFLEAIRSNPRAVIESAARNMGLELRDPQAAGTQANVEAVTDDVMEDMVNLFGPDLAPAVRPVMERMVQNLVNSQVAPLKAAEAQRQQESYEKQAQAFAGTFRARHTDITPETEAKMIEIGQKIAPSEGTTPDEYLEYLHNIATAGTTAARTAKVAAERIKAAQASAEPRRGAAPAKAASGIKADITLDEAFADAWAEVAKTV